MTIQPIVVENKSVGFMLWGPWMLLRYFTTDRPTLPSLEPWSIMYYAYKNKHKCTCESAEKHFFIITYFFYSVSIVTRHTVLVRLVIIAPESLIYFFCTGYIHTRYIWFLKTSLDKAWQTSTLFLYSISMPIQYLAHCLQFKYEY